jgi:hypothetical protein
MTTFTTQDRQDAQRTPLTDVEIRLIAHPFLKHHFTYVKETDTDIVQAEFDIEGFARAIERAHGISND